MNSYKVYRGELVELSLSGHIHFSGMLIDTGPDIMVIYNGHDFIYIPIIHIQYVNFEYENKNNNDIAKPDDIPIGDRQASISFRKILNNAKGIFTEIYVTGQQSIHGYITNIMNDYFVFYSPVYKTMFIPLHHLKFLKPYNSHERPYALDNEELPLTPSTVSLSRTFEEQCKKYIGKITIFDMGHDPTKIGKLTKIENSQIELVIARQQAISINSNHVKSLHFP
ncbi:DUF2642 domain-containing protein [Tuberibacillus sp. Marseille-P3662]|uniref:DUF2642 domain-containing protein n=1 Tax=Tuberibacillus sp. Marseille-P3662 TaxID=1965358 RepID=UPI000A1CEF2B|nr:DUF2642 domain-containing protein [Tuberibacillus sp. Marseille-P3662]